MRGGEPKRKKEPGFDKQKDEWRQRGMSERVERRTESAGL